MAWLLEQGALELLWLSVRGEPVAALYGMVWAGKVYAYQCGRYQVAAAEKDYLDGWWMGHAEFVRRADSMEGAQ